MRWLASPEAHRKLSLLAAGLAQPARPLAAPLDLTDTSMGEMPAFLRANKVPLLSLPALCGGASKRDMPPVSSLPLMDAYRQESDSFARQRAEYELVREVWEAEGIEAIFIKAVGLAPSFPYTSDNVDVYMCPEFGRAARESLRRLGFVELRNLEEPNKYLFKRFRGGEEVCAIHMHLRLEWNVSFLPEETMWQRRRVAPDDKRLRIPSPEDALLITLAHALYENKCVKLGDLVRADHCLTQYTLDWEYIWEVARSKGWLSGLSFCLLMLDKLDRSLYQSPAVPPAQVERAWESLPARWRRVTERHLAREVHFPFPIGFGFSKLLFFEKMLRDENEHWTARLSHVGRHVVTGTKLKLGVRSQPAWLISFSGVDGSGKSTQARIMERAFAQCGLKVRYVWSRGGASPLAAGLIRLGKRLLGERSHDTQSDSIGEQEETRAKRFRHPLARRLWPWLILLDLTWTYGRAVRWPLLRGYVVICDRYIPDALAECGAWLEDDRVERRWAGRLLRALNPRARYAFYLDVAPAVARARQPAASQQGTLELAERQVAVYNRLIERGHLQRVNGVGSPEMISDRLVYHTLTEYFDHYGTWLNKLLLSNPKPCSRGETRAVTLPARPAPMPFPSAGQSCRGEHDG